MEIQGPGPTYQHDLGQQLAPRSLSRGPCGNAYMRFPRVNAWIRAWPARHRRKHIHTIDVIYVSAKVLQIENINDINDVNDVKDVNVKVKQRTSWNRTLRHLEEISGPRPIPGSSFPCKSPP